MIVDQIEYLRNWKIKYLYNSNLYKFKEFNCAPISQYEARQEKIMCKSIDVEPGSLCPICESTR